MENERQKQKAIGLEKELIKLRDQLEAKSRELLAAQERQGDAADSKLEMALAEAQHASRSHAATV